MAKSTQAASTTVVLFALDRHDFSTLLGAPVHEVLERENLGRILRTLLALKDMSDEQVRELSHFFVKKEFEDEDVIIREGSEDDGKFYYVIRAGEANVEKEGTSVATLGAGDHFGEAALLNDAPRQASVIATAPTSCWMLSRDDFERTLVPAAEKDLKSIMRMRSTDTTQALAEADGSFFTGIGLDHDELERLQTIGVGSYGFVELVRFRGRPYALKILEKSKLARDQRHIINAIREKDLLKKLDHPFIVRLYTSFQGQDTACLLQEYVIGGELYQRIKEGNVEGDVCADGGGGEKNATGAGRGAGGGTGGGAGVGAEGRGQAGTKGLMNSDVRFYMACLVDTLAFVHAHGIVYRDLKPENVVIDNKGYPKLVDFGFAKYLGNEGQQTFTICGTVEYLAPEVLMSSGYAAEADMWALGVIVVEMLTGSSPFYSDHEALIVKNVLKANPVIPSSVSAEWKSFCGSILTTKQTLRPTAKDLQARGRILAGVDWKKLRAKQVPAPYVPSVKDPFDTSNFSHGYTSGKPQEFELEEGEEDPFVAF